MYKDTVLAIAQGNGYRDVVFLGIYKGMDVYFPIGGENENREGIPEYITVTFSKNSDEPNPVELFTKKGNKLHGLYKKIIGEKIPEEIISRDM